VELIYTKQALKSIKWLSALIKFVPVDIPAEDEIEAIRIAEAQYENGEYYKANEINWDNLDNMNLN